MGLDGQGRCGFLLLGNVDPSLLHGAPVGRRLVLLTLYQASVVLLHCYIVVIATWVLKVNWSP